MKAIVYTEYGSPDVLKLIEVEKPIPKENEVLINVHAVSVNPWDWHHLRGTPFLLRLTFGLFKPKKQILGADVAGRVEAVGNNVTQFKKDDEVFGEAGFGGFAEYVSVRENNLVKKPSNISFEEASAIPIAAISALQGLRDKGKIQAGQKILINGASGGVGTYAVQIAKSYGAEVTGVCSTRNMEMVRSIGADNVVDYTKEDFTKLGKSYDLIIDNVGNYPVSDFKRVLTRNGICVIIGFSSLSLIFRAMIMGPVISSFGHQQIGVMEVANINKEDLKVLQELVESGKVKSVIDKCYTFSETAEAVRYVERGHARGKVVVTIGNKQT
jgi:NADPH:quinone reductase-like Zn-dependent oxidoreductase